MQPHETLRKNIGDVDIYIVDQILKGRYEPNSKILDAGCGYGRNLWWFAHNNYDVSAIDSNKECIDHLQQLYPNRSENFKVARLEDIPFKDNSFHHVICSAVLHFAKDEDNYYEMFNGLVRVLKFEGTLFIRMASNFGMPKTVREVSPGVYHLPDGSHRFLLTKSILDSILSAYPLHLVEPVNTTNVEDKRWMTTLVLKKNN